MLAVNESKRKVRTRFGKQLYAIYIYKRNEECFNFKNDQPMVHGQITP